MKKIIITAIAILAILSQVIGSASAQGAELIVNGGFETPVVNTNVAIWDIFPSGTPGMGWQVEWYDGAAQFGGYQRPEIALLEIHRPGTLWAVYEGSQYAELDSDWFGPSVNLALEPASIRISQEIATCKGGVYELKYAWTPRPNISSTMLEVWWGDTLVASHAVPGAAQPVWTLDTMTVTAAGDTTRLSFVDIGPADSYGTFLDGVSLVQTNECPLNPRIDIKPGKYPNVIYPQSARYFAVAVLGSADFRVDQIDRSTLIFAGLQVRKVNGMRKCYTADVSGNFTLPSGAPDGYPDLVCQFVFDPNTFSPNADGTATLTGNLHDGTPFWGSDTLIIR